MKPAVLNAVGVICASFVCSPAYGVASPEQPALLTRLATYSDVHAQQVLGRTIVAPDGTFVLYEWSRPSLNWAPNADALSLKLAHRMVTFLYRIDVTAAAPTSEYLFYPNAGATYWLGDLSPDSRHVAVYELDRDDNRLRAGVWNLEEKKIRYFEPRADERQLGSATAWVSNEEFLYVENGEKAKLVRANVVSGETNPCPECSVESLRKAEIGSKAAQARAKENAARIEAPDVPNGATLLAASDNRELALYARDDEDVLMLMLKRSGLPMQVLFENARKWPGPEHTVAEK